jgi:PAS domain S-box-containing protein
MPTLQSATPVPRTVDDTLRRAELFHFLTEETDLLIYDYDVNSGRMAWQGPIAQVLGYPPEQFARMDVARWIASIHPEDRAATVKTHEQALADGGRFSIAYRFQHQAGHYLPIHDRGVVLLGAAPRLVGSIFDASEGPSPGLLVRMLLARTAATTGLNFLQTLVREGGLLLGGQRVGIARKLPGQSDTLHTVTAWQRDGLNPPAEFPIRNSPGRLALEQGYFETSGNLAAYFPQWAALGSEETIASYAGVALKTTTGKTLGLFWIMFGPEAKPPPSLAAIMRLFAVRASAELERLQFEQELATSHVRGREVVDGLPEGVLVTRDDQVLFANRAATKLFGYAAPAELLHTPTSAYIPSGVLAALDGAIRLFAAGMIEPCARETTLRRRDGSEFEVDLVVAQVDFEGQPSMQFVLRDITERRRLERAFEVVRRATAGVYGEEFFRSLVNELGPLLDGRRVFVGRVTDPKTLRIRSIAAWNQGEYREHMDEFTPDPTAPAWTVLHEGYCEVVGTLAERDPLHAAGYRAAGIDSYVGVALHASSGRVLGLLSVKYAQDKPLAPQAGMILQLFAARASAEMERLEVEEALRAGEARFRTLSECSPIGIFQLDRARECIYVNERWSEITGVTREQALGHGWMQSVHLDDRVRLEARHRADIGDYTAEMRLVLPGGAVRRVNMRVRSLHDAVGRIEGYVGTVDDISELAQADEEIRRLNTDLERRVTERTTQLAAANAELEAFSYSVSHDLRSPLRALDGFSRALEEDFAGRLDETGCGYLRRIRAASQHMDRLIDDLLLLSRTSRVEMRREPLDLSALAAEIETELRAHYPGRVVEFICAPDLRAAADRSLARIVLYNLLDNAWKYTRRQPAARIALTGHPAPADCPAPVFVVRDNGAGFDMRHAGKLFAPFQRLHAPTDFEGTGIGLATVKRIVTRHGGRVWADAVVASGANFYFTFGGFSL